YQYCFNGSTPYQVQSKSSKRVFLRVPDLEKDWTRYIESISCEPSFFILIYHTYENRINGNDHLS
ncbi:MAG TPA: hypothetical protein VFD91_16960, partial [Mariniphaga sp.]|nr:hypothetical protein [Mariniphaga sp.]